jgi:hypothetical protein
VVGLGGPRRYARVNPSENFGFDKPDTALAKFYGGREVTVAAPLVDRGS